MCESGWFKLWNAWVISIYCADMTSLQSFKFWWAATAGSVYQLVSEEFHITRGEILKLMSVKMQIQCDVLI